MLAPKDLSPEARVARASVLIRSNNHLHSASTHQIRAFLSDLKTRPQRQRELLCRLLRRAAVDASTKDSVVDPTVAHHTTAP
jgi:hypothetical protein